MLAQPQPRASGSPPAQDLAPTPSPGDPPGVDGMEYGAPQTLTFGGRGCAYFTFLWLVCEFKVNATTAEQLLT